MEQRPDWNERYANNDLPWETGKPSSELTKVLDEHNIKSGRALELGCGTGNNAVFLAQRGFDVTAFDVSELAVERTNERAKKAGVTINTFTADINSIPDFDEPFDFVFDRGVYHGIRQCGLASHISLLKKSCKEGEFYLTLAGNSNEVRPGERGPPRVSAEEMLSELLPIMELVQLREFRFEKPVVNSGPGRALAWSALFRRKSN